LGNDYDVKGRVSAQALLELGVAEDAEYLLCGPAPFLAGLSAGLEAAGIPAHKIRFEAFSSAVL
jgi:ferredoxin-NADP reductase